MRFLFFTDVHDDFRGVRSVLRNEKQDIDAAFVCGDLLYRTFFNDDHLFDFIGLQEIFHHLAEPGKFGWDIAQHILSNKESFSAERIGQAKRFLELFEAASKNIQEKYDLLHRIILAHDDYPVFTLPGNYDMDLKYTVLKNHDIHQKKLKLDGVRFSAHGGAPVMTPGIPEKMSVRFIESKVARESPIYRQFEEQKPDVILVHQPAWGIFDRLPSQGNIGSHAIRAYLDDHNPLLLLSGHIHEDFGIHRVGKTLCINPSNFGRVETIHGKSEGGFYCVIDMDNTQVNQVSIKVWHDYHCQEIYRYARQDNYREQVIDPELANLLTPFARFSA